ncbi:MAG: DUF2760 domain-containing protein [Opitutales bacterium]|nr:DUF2760 domain-containing protein [Opitutales bacterium]
MKLYAILAGVGIGVLNCLSLLPATAGYGRFFVAGGLALALWLVFRALVQPSPPPDYSIPEPVKPVQPLPQPEPPKAEPSFAAEYAAVSLLGALQEKGRLVDFLMDDVAAYSNEQVGAAARVVHQGGRQVLKEFFDIGPVSTEAEGSSVTVPEGAAGSSFRLIGKVGAAAPQSGQLVHKGWQTSRIDLPRPSSPPTKQPSLIAPAQVELR